MTILTSSGRKCHPSDTPGSRASRGEQGPVHYRSPYSEIRHQIQQDGSLENEPDTLLHEGPDVDTIREARVRSDDATTTHLPNSEKHLVQRLRYVSLEHQELLDFVRERLRLVERSCPIVNFQFEKCRNNHRPQSSATSTPFSPTNSRIRFGTSVCSLKFIV